MAVHVFNNPTTNFKTEVFAVLANIAWTYLMHEYYDRNGVKIEADGRTVELSKLLRRNDCPLSAGVKRNLAALKGNKGCGRAQAAWQERRDLAHAVSGLLSVTARRMVDALDIARRRTLARPKAATDFNFMRERPPQNAAV